MTSAEHESDLKLTTDTPYLTLTGELWGVCCEEIGENWLHYNGTALYTIVLPQLLIVYLTSQKLCQAIIVVYGTTNCSGTEQNNCQS